MKFSFCPQALKNKPRQNISKPDFGRSLKRVTQITALSLILTGFGFLPHQTAQAETARIDDITIDRQADETYDSLVERAEVAATAALEQGFSRGSQITDVYVVILGQNQGIISPVLAVGVSRPQWSSGSNDFTYFNSARSLLRLDEQEVAAAEAPPQPGTTDPRPPGQQQNNPNNPGSARELINAPAPVQPPTGAPPLPGSPTLVPRPQAPGVTPVTSPGDNFNPAQPSNPPLTTPTPQNLPQVDPANTGLDQR